MPGLDGAGDAAPDAAERQSSASADGTGNDWDYTFGPVAVNISAGTFVLDADAAEYVHAQVAATDAATGDEEDPTGLTVALAFTRGADPDSGDWQTGRWLTRASDGTTWARVKVTAGQLADGAYIVWVMVTDTVETSVGEAGLLIVE